LIFPLPGYWQGRELIFDARSHLFQKGLIMNTIPVAERH
jgi:hypothetical protein